MELRELRSFCTVAEFRSVTKAANHLGLGQPTVTLHVKALEDELGTALFDRSRRPLRLTPTGNRLLEFASSVLGGVDALRSELAGAETSRSLIVAATTELVGAVLDAVARWAQQENVDLRVKSGRVSEVLQMVRTREVSLALTPDVEGEATIARNAVLVCERVVLAPLRHPITSAELSYAEIARWPLIIASSRCDAASYLEEQLERNRLHYRTSMELDNVEAVKRYVAAGLGISVLPAVCVSKEDEERLAVIRIPHLLPRYRVAIVQPAGAFLPDHAKQFLTTLVECLRPRFEATFFPSAG